MFVLFAFHSLRSVAVSSGFPDADGRELPVAAQLSLTIIRLVSQSNIINDLNHLVDYLKYRVANCHCFGHKSRGSPFPS